MRVCLFEDRGAALLEPLASTRPVFDLLCGLGSLAGKQAGYFASSTAGVLVRPHLAACLRLQHPTLAVNDPAWLRAGPVVLVNGRWLPPAGTVADLPGPTAALVGEEVAYVLVEPHQLGDCSPGTLEDRLRAWKETLPRQDAGGLMVRYPWELVEHNPEQLRVDFAQLCRGPSAADCTESLAVVGPPERLWVDPTAHVDPLVLIDVTNGPVVIDQGAVVQAFSRIEGPSYIGPHCQLLGAKVRAGTTLGPYSRIGGEIEATIVQGRSNKYHDGFLGHSYLGEWVNLGAGTSNSDLRNDYCEVTVILAGEPVKTGLTKVGCFIGDHTKTALGTLLNTGSNIGVFCNLLPAGPLMPKYLPPFTSWWNGSLRETRDLPGLLETAALVMKRRGCDFTNVHSALYTGLFGRTASERRRAIHESEQRRLRRSA